MTKVKAAEVTVTVGGHPCIGFGDGELVVVLPLPVKYTVDYAPTPGEFDHRGLVCESKHGLTAHARERGATGPHLCVECCLEKLREGLARASQNSVD